MEAGRRPCYPILLYDKIWLFVISGHKKVAQYANTSLVVIQEENKL